MMLRNKEGVLVDCSLEVIKERIGTTVTWSDIREPTVAEVTALRNKPCAHSTQKTQLIYDEFGFMYDFRTCAICGCDLGTV